MTAQKHGCWLVALPCLWACALGSTAAAQVVALRVDPAAESNCQQIEAALSSFGLAPDPGYFEEAQRQGLDPQSDQALALLTPPLGVQLAVVPRASDGVSVMVEFRDGASGAPVGTMRLVLVGGVLDAASQDALRREVGRRLGVQQRVQPRGAPRAAEPGPDEGGLEPDEGEPDAAESEPGAAESEPAAGDGMPLAVSMFAGAGIGTRTLEWPSEGEALSVATGAFFAVDIGARFAIGLSEHVTLGPEFAYQTSLDHELDESHVAGATEAIGVRAHRFEALLALGFAIGESGFRIAPAVGFGVRALHPEVHHLLTPSYSLTGPVARLGVRIPFGDSVALRLAPELQLVRVGNALQERGVESGGLSLGGEGALEIELGKTLGLELCYREAHALLSSTQGGDTSDVERFVTARVRLQP